MIFNMDRYLDIVAAKFAELAVSCLLLTAYYLPTHE